ncbi:MAG: hypothetical protein KDA17_02140 [Candidatus Saccharibacteria bacterium]|nr:hypothetical protein [Candidatus Saccharibacteria bacterium]
MRNLIILLLTYITFTQSVFATLNDVDKGDIFNKNLLSNGGFEKNKYGWTASAGTFAITKSSPMVGRAHATWDAAASADTLISSATIPTGMYGRNGVASCLVRTASGTATHTIQAYDGTNILSSVAVTSSTTPTRASANFIFPSSGSIYLRIYANADEPSVAIDDCYLGPAEGYNVGNTSFIGSWTSYTPTLVGFATTTSVNFFYRIVGSSLEIKGKFTSGTHTAVAAQFPLPTGYTINSSVVSTIRQVGTVTTTWAATNAFTLLANTGLSYLTMGRNDTAASGLTNLNANTIGNTVDIAIEASVPVQELSGIVSAYRPDMQAMSWSGYHDSTCSWARTSTSFGDPTADATCAFAEVSNQNFGTVSTYTVTNAMPGIVFTPKKAGRYYVCATYYLTSSASNPQSALMVNGSTQIGYGGFGTSGASAVNTTCGIAVIDSVASTTISLQTKSTSGSVTIGSSGFPYSVHWSIFSIDQSLPAPVLAGSVTSGSSGVVKIGSAYITNSGTPTVSRQTGSWISSLTDEGTGVTTINMTSGYFSATPNCFCNSLGTGDNHNCTFTGSLTPSSTQIRVVTETMTTQANFDGDFYITCIGVP